MKKLFNILFAVGMFLGIYSCTQMDNTYSKYVVPGGIVYPGRAMNAVAYSGKDRVLLKWAVGADPNVTKARIYWNNYTDSVEIAIPTGIDTMKCLINNLGDNTYTFIIRTFDKDGNVSIPVEVLGKSYGTEYQNSLYNRSIISSNWLRNDTLHITWGTADIIDGAIATDIMYKSTTGDSVKVRNIVSNTDFVNKYPNYEIGTDFYTRTLYRPDSTAIDTFYTPMIKQKIEFQTELLNTVAPFAITGKGWWVQGRFGTPTDWIINDAAAQNGNVDNAYGNTMTMWAWSGYSPVGSFTNGKIYQTIWLGAGTYSFRAKVEDISNSGISYLVVAADYELPDMNNIERDALSFLAIPKVAKNTVLETSFTLTQSTVVSLGYIANIGHAQQVLFNMFDLVKK